MGHYRSEMGDDDGPPMRRVSEGDWHKEVARALTQLAQEVHALNPGIRLEFDLSLIRAPLEGQAHGDHSLFGGVQWFVPIPEDSQ